MNINKKKSFAKNELEKLSQAKACFMFRKTAAANMQACFKPQDPAGCSTRIRNEGRSWWTSSSQQPWVTVENPNQDQQYQH